MKKTNNTRRSKISAPRLQSKSRSNSDSVLQNEKAFDFVKSRLSDSDLNQVTITTWKTIDLLRHAEFKASVLSALRRRVTMKFVVGGIFGDQDLNDLLRDLRAVFSNRDVRSHFDKGGIQFSSDHNSSKALHAKCWLFESEKKTELVLGSFNLSQGAFFKNLEAAARVSPSEAAALIAEVRSIASDGLISPDDFLRVETKLLARAETKKVFSNERDFKFLSRFRGNRGVLEPMRRVAESTSRNTDLSKYSLVLRNPSRGEKVGYRIPKELIGQIFGDDFIGTKETDVGFTKPPESHVSPFLPSLTKKFKQRSAALSAVISQKCIPTSVGHVIENDLRDGFEERIGSFRSEKDSTSAELEKFSRAPRFNEFVMEQVEKQILDMRTRFAKQVIIEITALRTLIRRHKDEILAMAKEAADQMIQRMKEERQVSFIPLDMILDNVEGVSRSEVEAEIRRSIR